MTSVPLKLQSDAFEVVVADESSCLPRFDPQFADNIAPNERELFFGERAYKPSSRHRVSIIQEQTTAATCLLFATGGASCVHAHSALIRGDVCFVAVGPFVCALKLPNLELVWQAEVDTATCFGIYDAPSFQSIISHGECEIARLYYDGKVVWSSGGRDIFSEGFTLFDDHIEAIDFEGTRYRFDIISGDAKLNPA